MDRLGRYRSSMQEKYDSDTGNRTPSCRVRGGNVIRYTISDMKEVLTPYKITEDTRNGRGASEITCAKRWGLWRPWGPYLNTDLSCPARILLINEEHERRIRKFWLPGFSRQPQCVKHPYPPV